MVLSIEKSAEFGQQQPLSFCCRRNKLCETLNANWHCFEFAWSHVGMRTLCVEKTVVNVVGMVIFIGVHSFFQVTANCFTRAFSDLLCRCIFGLSFAFLLAEFFSQAEQLAARSCSIFGGFYLGLLVVDNTLISKVGTQ
jgi:hypothetical protein